MATAKELTLKVRSLERKMYSLEKSNAELVRFCEETQIRVVQLIDANNTLTAEFNIMAAKIESIVTTEKIISLH